MVKVRCKNPINENGSLYKIGDVFETDEKRAKALGSVVEIINVEVKAVEEPKKDKMIKESKKRK